MGDELETTAWIAALAGSCVFVIKTILMLVGGDHHDGSMEASGADLDMHAGDGGHDLQGDDHGSTSAFHLLSIQSLAVFAMAAGWMMLACLKTFKLQAVESVAVSSLFGLFLVYLSGKLLLKVRGLESSGTLDLRNAVGHQGTVYLHISEGGRGQVQVEVQGRLVTVDAVSKSGDLTTGTRVRVHALDGAGQLVVQADS